MYVYVYVCIYIYICIHRYTSQGAAVLWASGAAAGGVAGEGEQY